MSGGGQSGIFTGEVEVFRVRKLDQSGCLGGEIGPLRIMSNVSQLDLRVFACIKGLLAETVH